MTAAIDTANRFHWNGIIARFFALADDIALGRRNASPIAVPVARP